MLYPANTNLWLIPENRKTGYTAYEMVFLPQGGTDWTYVHHNGLSEQLAQALYSVNEERIQYQVANRYLFEVGNWSAIVQTSIAYAALAHQAPAGGSCTGLCQTMKDWIGRGLQASLLDYPGTNIEDADNYHYDYTSDEGRTWAEGPYYVHYAAPTLLSFWHALRVNQLNTRSGSPYMGGLPNPFLPSAWHLGPLRYLADLTTPQGQTPPLDDGNRHVMSGAYLLAWSQSYGEGSDDLGARFAWISRTTNQNLRTEDEDGEEDEPDVAYALLSLAIPPATREQAPANAYGPVASDGTLADQVLVRNASNYVLLNGEGRQAITSITRGHGHEQPDNLNLLWYVGRGSALMDAGYDFGSPFGSTWRKYKHQNVLYLDGRDECNGLRASSINFTSDDLVDPPNSWHSPASELDRQVTGNLTVLRGRQLLNGSVPGYVDGRYVTPTNGCDLPNADYRRDVLIVGDQEYLIDLNANLVSGDINYRPTFGNTLRHTLQYYIGASTLTPSQSYGDVFWSSGPLLRNSGQRLHLYPLPVEASFRRPSSGPGDLVVSTHTTRERPEQDYSAVRFRLLDPNDGRSFTTATVLTTQPTPPTTRPLRFPAGGTHAAFAWRRPKADGSADIDLYVARSSGALPGATLYVNPRQAYTHLPTEPYGQLPNAWFTLAPGVRYGFVRLNMAANGTVTSVPGYNLDLVPSSTYPALTASLVAPMCAQEGVPATMRVNVGGGLPWYDVSFETMPVGSGGGGIEASLASSDAPRLNIEPIGDGDGGGGGGVINAPPVNSWSHAGGPQTSIDLTRSASYDIRASVIDRNGTMVTTAPQRVTVQTMACDDAAMPPPTPQQGAEQSDVSRQRPGMLTVEAPRPNPATGAAVFPIGLPTGETAVLTAYDLLGREVARESVWAGTGGGWTEAVLDVSSWPSGLYVVRLVQGRTVQTTRLTVRH